jgi:regulator of protease activity HflC (stomatin/prohibitin superfamily)
MRSMNQEETVFKIGYIGVGLAFAAIIIGFLLFMSVNVVPAGHVGVVVTFGRVESSVLPPGIYLRLPVAQTIVDVETRVRPHHFQEIDAASREYQTVKLTGTLNYRIDDQRADEIYQGVGLEFAERVLSPAFNDAIKEVVPQFSVTEILVQRDEIRTRTKTKLSETLGRYGIVVEDVYLSNISFSAEYTQAIEQKQVAQQNVEREFQILEQKRRQAEQVEVEALGQARAQVARARGDSESRIAIAEGEAEANRRLSQSVSQPLIDYLRTTKWNGQVPQTVVNGETGTMITVPSP